MGIREDVVTIWTALAPVGELPRHFHPYIFIREGKAGGSKLPVTYRTGKVGPTGVGGSGAVCREVVRGMSAAGSQTYQPK
jgi:hypothetical protein